MSLVHPGRVRVLSLWHRSSSQSIWYGKTSLAQGVDRSWNLESLSWLANRTGLGWLPISLSAGRVVYRDLSHLSPGSAILWFVEDWVERSRCVLPGRGPRQEPCGISQVTSNLSELVSSITIHWLLPVKYEENQSRAIPLIPNLDLGRLRKVLWLTVSNAALH